MSNCFTGRKNYIAIKNFGILQNNTNEIAKNRNFANLFGKFCKQQNKISHKIARKNVD
jgi:hypothetical protein